MVTEQPVTLLVWASSLLSTLTESGSDLKFYHSHRHGRGKKQMAMIEQYSHDIVIFKRMNS